MMKNWLFVTMALVLPGWLPAAVDLTPRFSTVTTEDGGHLRRLYFNADGGKRVMVNMEHDVNVTGGAGETVFQFDAYKGATLKMRQSPHTPELPLEGDALAAYRTTVLSFAPPGAKLSGELEEKEAPFAINEWKSHRFIAKYDLPGGVVAQSVTFLNLDAQQQVVLVVTAYEKDFGNVSSRADGVLQSWRTVSEGDLRIPANN